MLLDIKAQTSSFRNVLIADNKRFTRIVVAAALIQTLDSLDLKYPEAGPDKLKELAAARAALVK